MLCRIRRIHLEEDLPAQQYQPEEDTWVQNPDADPLRPPDPEEKAGKGKKTSDSLKTESPRRSFPRLCRVRSRSDFLRAQQGGIRVQGRHLVLLSVANGLTTTRFGQTVSRKHGNAVSRNRIKRRIREIQRLNRDRFIPAYDIIVIPRKGAQSARFADLERELLELAGQAGLLLGKDQ